MEMLRHIAEQRLPMNIETEADMDTVRVLRAAGLVAAVLAKSDAPAQDGEHVARVLAITPARREALEKQPSGRL